MAFTQVMFHFILYPYSLDSKSVYLYSVDSEKVRCWNYGLHVVPSYDIHKSDRPFEKYVVPKNLTNRAY